jgi:hypothetical protein
MGWLSTDGSLELQRRIDEVGEREKDGGRAVVKLKYHGALLRGSPRSFHV